MSGKRFPSASRLFMTAAVLVSQLGFLSIGNSVHASASGLLLDAEVNQWFNGSSTFIDRSADIPAISPLTEGTLAARIRTTSTAAVKTILSASDVDDSSSNMSLTMNRGDIYFENREDGAYATQLTAPGTYNDGAWHSVVLTVDGSGTKVYVDGELRTSNASTAFFANVTGLDGLWIGKNADNGSAGQWYYSGDIDYVRVYGQSLSADEIADLYAEDTGRAAHERFNELFDGASGFVDWTSRLSDVSGLTEGSIVARVRSSAGGIQTILAATESTDFKGGMTLAMQGDGLSYEIGQPSSDRRVKLTTTGRRYNDGAWHTVALTVDESGSKLYVDGALQASDPNGAFFGDAGGLDGLWVGRDMHKQGEKRHFNGDIRYVSVYNKSLRPDEIELLHRIDIGPMITYSTNRNFNGSSTFIDITPDLPLVSNLTEGSIVAKVKSTSASTAKTILSASDTSDSSSNVSLTMNGGSFYYELRENGEYIAQATAAGSYNDGDWHTVALTVGEDGTILYVDGRPHSSDEAASFFAAITDLDGMWIGRNVDDGGAQWHYSGDIEVVRIYDRALSASEVEQISSPTSGTVVYKGGLFGSNGYRIPSLLTTVSGTLIAGIDQRIPGNGDSPNDINTAIRRSTDGGATWGDLQVLVDYPGTGTDAASAIDSSLLQDRTTGTIWMLVDHFPGGIGFRQSVAGTGFDEDGRKLLYDAAGTEYSLCEDGIVYDGSGTSTGYSVNVAGDVFQDGEFAGNIYSKEGVYPQGLVEERTSFLQLIRSDDDGQTWSEPIDINAQVKEDWMKFMGSGPGSGIQIENGAYAGRLVFPVYYMNGNGRSSTAVIYSDDQGLTWHRGASPNDGRIYEGVEIDSQTLNVTGAQLSEAAVVEYGNGMLRLYMRNSNEARRAAVASSSDGGATWSEVTYDERLLDPNCQMTAIRYPDLPDDKERILFANPASTEGRQNGTMRLSEDGGTTWSYAKAITPEGYAYSSLSVLPNGEIGLLYEDNKGTVYFKSFTLDWIKTPYGG